MAGASRRPGPLAGDANSAAVTWEPSSTEMDDVEFTRMKLRERWEFATVLNFFHVFHPMIGKDLKLSAEEVETAIIEQNSTLAQLHIALLEGIIPSTKTHTLKPTDAWIVALSKTLSKWWHWVAEGDFPLTGAKGDEISIYKELEPTARVVILKALCEVRADQYDIASYVNQKMKDGTDVSYFRKDKLASDGNRVAFWYEGSETIGHRLYKEVHSFENQQAKSKGTVPAVKCQWETLATNLEEFNKIVFEFSSSKLQWEVELAKSVETDVIPVLEKQQKKKQKELYRRQREQSLWNGFRKSVSTRSCRSNKPVDYRFDSYDKVITEAIKYQNNRKIGEERIQKEKPSQKRIARTADGSNNSPITSRNSESTETDTEKSNPEESDNADDDSIDENADDGKQDLYNDEGTLDLDEDEGKVHSLKQSLSLVQRSKGLRVSTRAGIPDHTITENENLGLKNRLRQRPSVNAAVESIVVPDSEDESSSGDTR